jgi:hypothetical protein
VADWATISALATASGTLALAAATFVAVRSAQASARITERALLASTRPVLVPSRLQDPPEKIGFMDDHWLKVDGGIAAAEATPEAIYLGFGVRNVGTGLAVLDRWYFWPEVPFDRDYEDPSTFRRLTRDLYVPAGDTGFWQGALRDPSEELFVRVRDAINSRTRMGVDVLYGDHEGGQRTISRFSMVPLDDGRWLTTIARHWNLDRAAPR